MMLVRSVAAALVVGLMSPVSMALAQSSLLDRWYTALFDVNRVAITDLLADDATIRLEDLGVTQTKAEFIASLDEWEDIVKTADLAWQQEEGAGTDETTASVLVCYQFPDTVLLIREVFAFHETKISSVVQTTVADNCEEF